MVPRRSVKYVLFDFDGLLVDSEGAFDQVIQEYARTVTGRPLPEEVFIDLRIAMFGRKKEESARLLYEALHLDPAHPPADYLVWRKPRLEPLFREVDLLPGAKALLEYLSGRQIPMAIATSSSRSDLEIKLTKHPFVLEIFQDRVVTGDQVLNGKPDPELFLKAAQLIGAVPFKTLVFEDAANGVAAAKAAGMSVVAVPHPLLSKDQVSAADEVLTSLAEFNPQRWGL